MSGWAIQVSEHYESTGTEEKKYAGLLYEVGYIRSREYDDEWIESNGGFDDEFVILFETYDAKTAAQMCHYLNGGEANIDSLFKQMLCTNCTDAATVMGGATITAIRGGGEAE